LVEEAKFGIDLLHRPTQGEAVLAIILRFTLTGVGNRQPHGEHLFVGQAADAWRAAAPRGSKVGASQAEQGAKDIVDEVGREVDRQVALAYHIGTRVVGAYWVNAVGVPLELVVGL